GRRTVAVYGPSTGDAQTARRRHRSRELLSRASAQGTPTGPRERPGPHGVERRLVVAPRGATRTHANVLGAVRRGTGTLCEGGRAWGVRNRVEARMGDRRAKRREEARAVASKASAGDRRRTGECGETPTADGHGREGRDTTCQLDHADIRV